MRAEGLCEAKGQGMWRNPRTRVLRRARGTVPHLLLSRETARGGV
jgi:hypothetical protein